MDRLEIRELAYFVAVAETRHFGRAALRLGIAQPPLSRAIKQLERRLGVQLCERTSQGVLLTAAGEALLAEARPILAASMAAVARTRRAGQPSPRLVLIVKPGGDGGRLPALLAAYARDPDAVAVDIRGCRIGEQADLLRAGVGDVAILHGHQQDLTGLDTEQLALEPQIAVLPKDHPLAGRTELRLAELQGQDPPLWSAATGDGGDLAQLIALGRTIALVPYSAGGQLRRDLIGVPVPDATPTPLLLAWPQHQRARSVAAFVRIAVELAHPAATN